jgi:hypothetical protein
MAKRRATIVKERNAEQAAQDKIDVCLEGLFTAYKKGLLPMIAYENLLKMGHNVSGERFITTVTTTLRGCGLW